jgi:hypothetical protein
VVFVVVVTRTKTMIMTIVLSGTKVTMVYVWYHFVPHLAVNHLEIDKCMLRHTNFMLFFGATLRK